MWNGIFGKKTSADQPAVAEAVPRFGRVTAEDEARIIAHYLEKKFNHKFRFKIKVDGYIDDMEYKLVLTDDQEVKFPEFAHTLYGNSSKDIFSLYQNFCAAYWRNIARIAEIARNPAASQFEKTMEKSYSETAIASSRDELMFRASVEGLI